MSRIYTVSDHAPACAMAERGSADLATLYAHHPHEWHCGGWEVLAWPCPTAAKVLDRLLGGAA